MNRFFRVQIDTVYLEGVERVTSQNRKIRLLKFLIIAVRINKLFWRTMRIAGAHFHKYFWQFCNLTLWRSWGNHFVTCLFLNPRFSIFYNFVKILDWNSSLSGKWPPFFISIIHQLCLKIKQNCILLFFRLFW